MGRTELSVATINTVKSHVEHTGLTTNKVGGDILVGLGGRLTAARPSSRTRSNSKPTVTRRTYGPKSARP